MLAARPSHFPRRAQPARLRAFFSLGFALLTLAAGPGCATHHPIARTPAPVPSSTPAPSIPPSNTESAPAAPGAYIEEGVASWYGVPFNGHRTSNGEIYDMFQLTAAHRTLPFGAIVRVTNLINGQQTEVRINDRGPFVAGRIIDLSLAAAQAIGLVGPGTGRVRLELVSGPNPFVGFFAAQVGAFQVQENAERLRENLAARYAPVSIQLYDSGNGLFYRVRVGRVPSQEAAQQLADQLRSEEQLQPFVVRLDE
jgi:rare lipoprotein A